jgi:hypothetical protein
MEMFLKLNYVFSFFLAAPFPIISRLLVPWGNTVSLKCAMIAFSASPFDSYPVIIRAAALPKITGVYSLLERGVSNEKVGGYYCFLCTE